jgi:hypothetical protein
MTCIILSTNDIKSKWNVNLTENSEDHNLTNILTQIDNMGINDTMDGSDGKIGHIILFVDSPHFESNRQ